MERIRSRAGRALGGAGLVAVLLLGTGCACRDGQCGATAEKSGWTPGELFAPPPPDPAVSVVAAFMQQVQYLPDPARNGVNGAGLTGQMFLLGKKGQYVPANGDVVVMVEDTTPRGGQPSPYIPEVYHIDAATLKKLKTNDERFGDCYALFLPYPKEWMERKDVSTVRASAKYIPAGTKGQDLTCSPQLITLDFSTPGSRREWTDKGELAGGKATAPTETRGIPDIGAALAAARGKLPGSTAQAGGVPPKTGVVNAGGVPPGTTVSRGPSGEKVTTTAVALPADHPLNMTVDPAKAWVKDPLTGALRPNIPAPAPAPAPAPGPAMPTGPSAPVYVAPALPPISALPPAPAPVPPLPVAAPPVPDFNVLPTRSTVPTDPTTPAIPIPTPPGATSGAPVPPPNFDPTSPVGAWANPNPPAPPTGELPTYTVPRR